MEKEEKYKQGDLVYVKDKNFTYPDGTLGEGHSFVVLDENNIVDLSYFAFIVSSNLKKLDEKNFPYNVGLLKDDKNNLRKDSIVKCDAIYNIKSVNIKGKFGEVEPEKMIEFIDKNKKFVESIKHKSPLSKEQVEYLKKIENQINDNENKEEYTRK